MAKEAACARKALAKDFKKWLNSRFSPDAQQYVDKQQAVRNWVTEAGNFEPGTGQSIWKKCERCDGWAFVMENGKVARESSQPACLVRDFISPIVEWVE